LRQRTRRRGRYRAQGELLHAALVATLKTNDVITLNFGGLQTATFSFVNLGLVPLLGLLSLDEIKRRIKIVQSSRQINEMIKMRLLREAESDRR
jgi:hypothetical protein